MSPDPVITVTLPAPVPQVWQHLRDPRHLRRWHGWDFEGFEAELQAVYQDGAIVEDDGRSLRIGGHLFVLEDHGETTRLLVTRAAPTDDTDWGPYYADVEEGWTTFLQQLRLVLAARPRGPRDSTMDGELDRSPDDVVRALGVDPAAAPGTPWRGRLADGTELSGTVWFRTPRQAGLAVDQWGPGLLTLCAVADRAGAGQVVLSAYGLEGTTARDLVRRLHASWRPATA